MFYTKTRLKGGRVMVHPPLLIPGQSAWKGDKEMDYGK